MAKETNKKQNTKAASLESKKRTAKNRSSHEDAPEEKPKAEAPKKKKKNSGTEKKTGEKRQPKGERVNAFEEAPRNKMMFHQMMPYLLMILAVFLLLCFVLIDGFEVGDSSAFVGTAGGFIRDALCGLFGYGAFFVPIVLAILSVGWYKAVEDEKLLAKNLYGFFFMFSLSTLLHGLFFGGERGSFPFYIAKCFEEGKTLESGGAVGGFLGDPLSELLGSVGFPLIFVPLVFIFFVFLIGLTPSSVMLRFKYFLKVTSEKHAAANEVRREERAQAKEERRKDQEAKRAAAAELRAIEARELELKKEQLALMEAQNEQERQKREEELRQAESAEEKHAELPPPIILAAPPAPKEEPQRVEAPAAEEPTESDEEGVYIPAEAIPARASAAKQKDNDEHFSLEEIFKNEATSKPVGKPKRTGDEPTESELDVQVLNNLRPITEFDEVPEGEDDGIVEIVTEAVSKEPEMRMYAFPPVALLAEDVSNKNSDHMAELSQNAQKLMDTLASFNIRIKGMDYSRGPTITRYELQPEAGVRVRSIANLVDDISLSLATTGVRIEAPIPNKPAVGIEVPNQTPETVYLRSLIDTERFENEQSRLTACLGADVAGHPIYFNIAKMPHLLIAGATGMGKSVCINSIIMSLLYKAKPDEVKLILIDPKKVEFNIYKDIPHLYAPIVSEPTKAAGALASAVAEMERRFELIEEVGVRDIYNYNAVTKDDPDREFMPQMVIIIDELADLMMTAADSVESSICRLAQKARAAGIHIIIGTQRPSVDVITGLIKANVPSRIAFTVASQVDSRTIIDIAGAEKLIGRGDMLFAPVGAAKPMRVQGAFVSESEVEKVVEFIKANNMGAKYNEEFISRIEEEAAKCAGAGKKGASGEVGDVGADGLDPKFRAAVEVAVDSGKISTSLLQRKLEIGYGRAAKIIDQMEEMGYVSAPEGNKPRKILITKEDFMQMVVNDEIE